MDKSASVRTCTNFHLASFAPNDPCERMDALMKPIWPSVRHAHNPWFYYSHQNSLVDLLCDHFALFKEVWSHNVPLNWPHLTLTPSLETWSFLSRAPHQDRGRPIDDFTWLILCQPWKFSHLRRTEADLMFEWTQEQFTASESGGFNLLRQQLSDFSPAGQYRHISGLLYRPPSLSLFHQRHGADSHHWSYYARWRYHSEICWISWISHRKCSLWL